VAFAAPVAPFVGARVWHPSQRTRESSEHGLVVTLDVCNDAALRSWILSWGPAARVLAPASLANDVRAALRSATAQYED